MVGIPVLLDLGYEAGELRKDLCFLSEGEAMFISRLGAAHRDFGKELAEGVDFLRGVRFSILITDRDGTVNCYGGRYASSLQAVYSALFLARFAKRLAANPVLLSSGPLGNGGLLDLSVMPEGLFVYAGSKGREFVDRNGRRGALPIGREKQEMLDRLNARLAALTREPEFRVFSFVGSGLQLKHGETTIARQDVYGSIPQAESERFAELVRGIVDEIDPGGRWFAIEDTGTDLEIVLVREGEDARPRAFDKGDGVEYLDKALGLELHKGPNLVCGDTRSDIPMVRAAAAKGAETYAVFVTADGNLGSELERTCPKSLVLSHPDILLCVFNELSEAR